MAWCKSVGTLRYGPGIRLVVEADDGIAEYYRSLLPKAAGVKPQRYGVHISVVRKETPPIMDAWGRHEGQSVEFEYQNLVVNDEKYYWLDVRCQRLEEVRVELGLSPRPWWKNYFHLTVGNVKDDPPVL
jgi:hypothetical protein